MIFLLILSVSITGCVSSQTTQSNPTKQVYAPVATPTLPQTCIGDCKIGQSATDGKYNHQKFTLNAAYILKHPYNDPDPDIGKEWHNWDWVVLDVSLENLRPKESTYYGIDELTLKCHIIKVTHPSSLNLTHTTEYEFTVPNFFCAKPLNPISPMSVKGVKPQKSQYYVEAGS